MNMVGHDDPFVQNGIREMRRNFLPDMTCNVPEFVLTHHIVHDPAKKACAIVGAYCYEVRIWLGVIEINQSDGFPFGNGRDFGIVCHEIFDPRGWSE